MANIKLYAYFDIDTGNILAFSNELISKYEYKLEVTTEEYHRFVSGIERFSDWVVSRSKNVDCEYELVQKEKQHILFKNNLLEKIISNSNLTPELMIHWDAFKNSWVFVITDKFRQRIYDENHTSNIRHNSVEFYITLVNEPNMLIQSIKIDLETLIQDKTIIPFVSNYELDIKQVDVFTRTQFFSYGIQEWKN